MKLYQLPFYGQVYRTIMKLSHRFNWHYAKPNIMEDGSTMRWCHWCGMRDVTKPYTDGITKEPKKR